MQRAPVYEAAIILMKHYMPILPPGPITIGFSRYSNEFARSPGAYCISAPYIPVFSGWRATPETLASIAARSSPTPARIRDSIAPI